MELCGVELKNGYVISFKNGNRYMYIDDVFYNKLLQKLNIQLLDISIDEIANISNKPHCLLNDILEKDIIYSATDWNKIERGTLIISTELLEFTYDTKVEKIGYFDSVTDAQTFLYYEYYDRINDIYYDLKESDNIRLLKNNK